MGTAALAASTIQEVYLLMIWDLAKRYKYSAFWNGIMANFARQESHRKPYLIVAPIALLENWAAEYPKFFDKGALNFITLYGKELKNYKIDLSEANKIQIPEIEGIERLKNYGKSEVHLMSNVYKKPI